MLSELKQELEYCREKWERARQKNYESETEWKKLRREFAARKSKGCKPSSLNDSGESGFSDEQNESGDDSDTERSGTESPVDQILVEEEEEEKGAATAESKVETNYSVPSTSNFIEELIKQSEQNLKQTTENLEETKLEECEEVNKVLRTISRARESGQTDDREKAREARDLRLKRLEEQCKLLVRQVDITKHKSNYLNTRLEELHEQYTTSENNRIRNKAGTSSQTMTTEEDDEGTTNDETDQQQTSSESDNQSNEFSKSDGTK